MYEDGMRQIWRKVVAAINSCSARFLIGMTACEHHFVSEHLIPLVPPSIPGRFTRSGARSHPWIQGNHL
jgi:hypothetical protein